MHTFSGSLCLSSQNAQKCDNTRKSVRMLKSVTLPGKGESCKSVGIGECSFPHTRSSHPIMEDEQKLPLCLHNPEQPPQIGPSRKGKHISDHNIEGKKSRRLWPLRILMTMMTMMTIMTIMTMVIIMTMMITMIIMTIMIMITIGHWPWWPSVWPMVDEHDWWPSLHINLGKRSKTPETEKIR